MRYSRWDEVVLKIDDSFGGRDKTFARVKVMILGVNTNCDPAQYLCYVPPYERIPYGFPTFIIDKYHAKQFELDDKFLGDTGCFITTMDPIYKHVAAAAGEKCDHCKNWVEGALREDGVYLCRLCRDNPYR